MYILQSGKVLVQDQGASMVSKGFSSGSQTSCCILTWLTGLGDSVEMRICIPWPEEYYVGQKMLSLLDSIWRQICRIAKLASFLKLHSESKMRGGLEDELVTGVNIINFPLFPNALCIQWTVTSKKNWEVTTFDANFHFYCWLLK